VMGRVVGVANDGRVVDIYRYLVDPVCIFPRTPVWWRALELRRSDWYTLDILCTRGVVDVYKILYKNLFSNSTYSTRIPDRCRNII
jgi:hypothetical protein